MIGNAGLYTAISEFHFKNVNKDTKLCLKIPQIKRKRKEEQQSFLAVSQQYFGHGEKQQVTHLHNVSVGNIVSKETKESLCNCTLVVIPDQVRVLN